MDYFDIIQSGFNNADETINFGTRCLTDFTDLYETATLAYLRSSQDVVDANLSINAVVRTGRIFYSINRSLRIFDDKECSNVCFFAQFEENIDSYAISSDGKYLVICLLSGMVHVLDISSEENTCVFSGSLASKSTDEKCYIGCFVETNQNHLSFILVAKNGQIFRLKFSGAEITHEVVYDFQKTVKFSSYCFPNLIIYSNTINMLHVVKGIRFQSMSRSDLIEIHPFANLFLGLDKSGNLIGICKATLLQFPMKIKEKFRSITVYSNDNKHILVGWTFPDENNNSYIKSFEYPEMKQEFSIKLQNDICLVQPESFSDETLFISKISEGSNLTEIRFLQIYESEPIKRLERLIRKNKLDEAEELVKLFNLDPDLLSKAKAQMIIDKPICEVEDMNNLVKLLDLIEDDYFKLETCKSMAVASFFEDWDSLKQILYYGCGLSPTINNENKENIKKLQQELVDLLFKFETFLAISQTSCDFSDWHTFYKTDNFVHLKEYIQSFKIEEAIILYSRLDDTMVSLLTLDVVNEILKELNNLPIETYTPFLSTFIPVTLKYQPASLPLFVSWLHNKIYQMENRHKNDFPESGITFAKFFINLLRYDSESTTLFQTHCIIDTDCIEELSSLMKSLDGLLTLKREYGISLSLSQYMKGPKHTVRQLLNIPMAPEDYGVLLQDFLYKFMVQHQLEPNEIFLQEIENLMMYREEYWSKLVGSILQCITSTETKLRAIKIILVKANVPWTANIRQIAHEALSLSHPLVTEIKECISNETRRVVLKRPKYFIKGVSTVLNSNFELIIQKMVRADEPTLLEDVRILCKSSEDTYNANCIIMTHIIRVGKFQEALEILSNNTPEDIYSYATYIVNFIKCMVSSGRNYPFLDNLYDISGSIYRRLIDNTSCTCEKQCYEQDLLNLKYARNLNKQFGTNYQVRDIEDPNIRSKIRDEILDDLIVSFSKKTTITDLIHRCDQMAKYLSLNKDEVCLMLCKKLKNFDVIYQSAQLMYNTDAGAKDLCLAAVLLFKYIGTNNCEVANESFDGDETCFQVNNLTESSSNNFLQGLKLAEKMCVKAMMKATDEEKMPVLEVAQWIDSCFYLNRIQSNGLSEQLFPHSHVEKQTLPSFSTFSSIRNLFESYVMYTGCFKDPCFKYLRYFSPEEGVKDYLIQEIKQLRFTVNNLLQEGHHLTVLHLLSTLKKGLVFASVQSAPLIKAIDDVWCNICIPVILQSVAARNVVDALLWNLDNNLTVSLVTKYFRHYKRQPQKLLDLSKVALNQIKVKNINVSLDNINDAIVNINWWRKFRNCPIPYDAFFKMNLNLRLRELIKFNCLDEETLLEYCTDNNLNVGTNYIYYLKHTLLNWKPLYDIQTNIFGQKVLKMRNNEDMLLEKVKAIMSKISNSNAILETITEISEKVNFYHYEVLITIMKIKAQLTKKERTTDYSILNFLKGYQRISAPGQNEKEQWFTTFPDIQTIDPLSEFRLPFSSSLFTSDIWDIIRSEVNLKTYKSWFDAINILKTNLNKDDICCYVVKEVVSSGILGKCNENEWILHRKHEDLFAEIDECINNSQDLERKTSAVYHLMINTPKGADQVEAAKMAYKYAVEYKINTPDSANVEKAYTKVKKKYLNLSATHILYVNQLNDEKYLELVNQPDKLINALYMDPRILKRAEAVNIYCPDINKAVDELAEFFNINIYKLRYELFNSWLKESDCYLESTFLMVGGDFDCSTEDNLKRVAYVCTSGDPSYWHTHLISVGMNDSLTDEKQDVLFKLNALKCLCEICNEEKLVQLTGATHQEMRYRIDKLNLSRQLESFGFKLDLDTLNEYDKKNLLKRLAKECVKPSAVAVMAVICMTYQIEDMKYWKFIIRSAEQLKMYSELRTYLEFLTNKPCQYKPYYISAWQLIIEQSFHINPGLTTTEIHDIYIKNFLMIQSCPVLYSINFEKTLQICLYARKYEFAAILLPYLPQSKRESTLQNILNQSPSLLSDLDKLKEHGIWIKRVKALLQ